MRKVDVGVRQQHSVTARLAAARRERSDKAAADRDNGNRFGWFC